MDDDDVDVDDVDDDDDDDDLGVDVAVDVLVTPNNALMHLDILKCIYTKQPVSEGISPWKFLASRAFENAERLLDDVGCKTSTLLRGM